MKVSKYLALLLFLFLAINCKKNDDDQFVTPAPIDITDPDPEPEPEPEPESENQAPGAFSLLEVKDRDTAVTLTPTFRWNTSTDPDGDMVGYDLLIGNDIGVLDTIATDLNTATYKIDDRLSLFTEYFWTVAAKDSAGLETGSDTLSFVTRRLNNPMSATTAAFPPRRVHTVTLFNDKLWLYGGQNQDGILGDVWSSDDGTTWTGVEDTDFAQLRGHAAVVFKDTLWLLGGRFGTSTTTRTKALFPASENKPLGAIHLNAPWPARELHTAAVFQDKVWVLGGVDNENTPLNDVWSTTNVHNWESVGKEETPAAPWSARLGHSTVIFQDKLWVIGGFGNGTYLNDVWSFDGTTWVEETPQAPFLGRISHATAVFDDKIWLFGGNDLSREFNDVWYSEDGKTWTRFVLEGNFKKSVRPTLTDFNDQMLLIGGSNGTEYLNDIWVFD